MSNNKPYYNDILFYFTLSKYSNLYKYLLLGHYDDYNRINELVLASRELSSMGFSTLFYFNENYVYTINESDNIYTAHSYHQLPLVHKIDMIIFFDNKIHIDYDYILARYTCSLCVYA